MSEESKFDMSQMSEEAFQDWLNQQGFFEGSEPHLMFESMHASMLKTTLSAQAAICNAEEAVSSARKARGEALAAQP